LKVNPSDNAIINVENWLTKGLKPMTHLPILVNVRGIIIRKNKVLLIKMNDENGMYFTYPGGTVRQGESIYDTLKRGIILQTCAEIQVHRLLMVWEYLPEKEGFRYGDRQKIALVFLCKQTLGKEPQMPKIPDPNQIDVTWLPLHALDELPVLPVIGKELQNSLNIKINTGNLFLNSTN